MENDSKLRDALKSWQLPGAPPTLDARVAKFRRSRWQTILTGSIRIPIPVGLAIAVALVAMAVALARRPTPPPVTPTLSLTDFHPVSDLNVRVIHSHENK